MVLERSNLVARLKAFLIHFAFSALFISIFVLFVLFIWYPSPYDYFYSPWNIIKIVLGVDLVIGPLLTLIVYDVRKKLSELKRDVSIVILFQLVAFVWGVHVSYASRPIVLIFFDDTFYMFSRDELDVSAFARKELEPQFWESPSLAYWEPPKSSDELSRLYEEYFKGEKPELKIRTERYRPLHDGFSDITDYSIKMEALIKTGPGKKIVDNFLNKHGGGITEYVFFPIRGTSKKGTIVFKKDTAEIEGLIESSLNK